MEGTTEPVVAVIGHPIAGNPMQFALENGFAHAGLECRVLSFDLPDKQLVSGLEGMEALNFRGVWVDRSRRERVQQWLTTRPADPSKAEVNATAGESQTDGQPQADPSRMPSAPLDALHRVPSSFGGKLAGIQDLPKGRSWQPLQLRDAIWPNTLEARLDESGHSLQGVLVVGDDDVRLAQITETFKSSPWDLEASIIESVQSLADVPSKHPSNVILLLDGVSAESDRSNFMQSDGRFIVDLAESWIPSELAAWEQYKMSVGRSSIGRLEIQAECLVKLTQTWFQRDVPADVFREALEEYLVV